MNSEQITAFLQAHWEWVTLIMGIVSVAGSILNWNWMSGRFICIACTHDIVGIYESCLYSVFNFTGGCFWVSICIYNDGSNS